VGWPQAERRQMARRVNEYTANLVARRPVRQPVWRLAGWARGRHRW